jgi:hypothetical protein
MLMRQIALFAIVCFSLVGCEAETSTDAATAPEEGATDALGSGVNGTTPDVSTAIPQLDTSSITGPDADRHAPDVTMEEDAGPSIADVMADVMVAEDVALPPWVVSDGACTEPSDLAVLETFDPMTDMMSMGMACSGAGQGGSEEEQDEAVHTCFVDALTSEFGFSDGCSWCVADHMICVQEMCMSDCMGASMDAEPAPECLDCIDTSGCKSEFTDCTGIDPDLFDR